MSTSDRVIMGVDGVQFFEPDLIHKVTLRNAGPLDGDTYVDLPTTSGTLATQGYVANATGGTFVGLTSDFTNTTAPTVDVTGMSFTVEAGRSYWIEGAILWYDNAVYESGRVSFSSPASTTFDFWTEFIDSSTGPGASTWQDSVNSGVYNQQSRGNGFDAFRGILRATNSGTVQLRFANASGDGTTQGLRAGSFIRIIDPQA